MKHRHATTETGGFTLVELMIVVAIIGLLAVMAIPSYVRARNLSQVNTCLNNLRQLSGAIDQYAIENNKTDTYSPTDEEVTPYLKGDNMPTCPSGGSYDITTVDANPTCSIGGDHVLPN